MARPLAQEPAHGTSCEPSWLDHDLDCFPLVHRAIAVRHAREADDPVEDAAWFDPAVEDLREQYLDVGARRCGPAADGDVVVESRLRGGHRLALRNADAADGAARTGDADRRLHGLVEADTFQDGVGAVPAGQLLHTLDRLRAALADDV